MKREISKKKGFTLIELLIVIAIIASLSVLAVSSYIQYRKSALIDLNTDSLISQISEMRGSAIYKDDNGAKFEKIKAGLSGEVVDAEPVEEDSDKAKCYGMEFKENAGKYEISSFIQIFENKKKVEDDGVWRYVGCGGVLDPNFIGGVYYKDFEISESVQLNMDEQITILSIADDKGSELSDFALRFRPPDGSMEVTGAPGSKIVSIVLGYGEGENTGFQKRIDIDLLNANFTKKNVEITP